MGKLMAELKLVFQPRERSDRWFSSSGASQSTNRSFDTKYIYNILTRRVDFPALHAWLPQGVKVHLNGDGRRKLVWDADEDIYWSPDCSSVVSALGELYLLKKSVLQRDFFIRHETNDCYDAIVAVLLFETIDLLALSTNTPVSINVDIPGELNREDIEDASLQVQWKAGNISVVKNDELLLVGKFEMKEDGGYFPFNLEETFINERLVRFEILWQDNYLDFINTVFDYGYSHFRSDLTGVIFDPAKHRVELEKRCSLLAIIELETGICQSGGIVLQFSLLKNGPDIEEIKSPYTEDLLMHNNLVYDITKQTAGNVMVLYASGTKSRKRYLVVSLSTEEIIFQKRIEIDQSVKPKHMVQVLPYLLSHYVLHSVLQLEKNQTLLIQPPYDPMSIFIAEMASNLCQRVYVSSWSVEQSVDLMEMLPEITVMWGVHLTNNLLSRTHGHGCDAVIKFIGNDINAAFLNLADNGKLVLFGSPDPTESLGLVVFLKNITFLVTEPLDAVSEFLKADDSSLDSDLVNGILNPKFLKHLEDGLLEEKSSLYSLVHSFEFKSLVSVKKMLMYLEDFEDKQEYFEYFEKIKNTLGPTLKKHFRSPINLNDTAYADPTHTLSPTQTLSASQKSVSTPIIVITPSPNEDFTAENVYDGSSNEAENGDESDLHVAQNGDGISPLQQPVTDTAEESLSMKRSMEARGKNFPPSLKLVSLHSETLLVLSPSKHPLSPNIHKLMKANRIKANLEPLNSVESQETPLFIVHPITGVVSSLLKPLGQALSVPCFGIKMTDGTPTTSVTEMVSFYISVVEAAYPKGLYRLAGYSFGARIALEMALQLQASSRMVECLILVDGSPDYVHAHCNLIRREIPTDYTQKLLSELMNLGYLLTFIEMYKPKCKDSKALLRASLLKLNDTESRLEWTVDYLLGKSIARPLPAKKNWLMASFKMMEKKKEQPLVSTTHEVLRISRTEKARDFLRNCRIGYEYMSDKRYYGCIHFMRIKDEPRNAFPLPSDYGLSKFCDDLTIRYYDGDHLTVMNDATMALDIENILKNL